VRHFKDTYRQGLLQSDSRGRRSRPSTRWVAAAISLATLCSLAGVAPTLRFSEAAYAAGSSPTAPNPPDFGTVPVGQEYLQDVKVTNTASSPLSLNLRGSHTTNGIYDYFAGYPWETSGTSCVDNSFNGVSIPAGGSCNLGVYFLPTHFGRREASLVVPDSTGGQLTLAVSGTGVAGYYVAGAKGELSTYGWSTLDLESGPRALTMPVVDIASRPYGPAAVWSVAADGGVFTAGGAKFYGSTGNVRLHRPMVGIAATPSDGGYWLVASDGGIFTFGDARFYGSTGNVALNRPIVGMASTPDGKGYWLVASDGGIFTFGDARFEGSAVPLRPTQPVVGIAASPRGDGYWMITRNGDVFNFNVPFQGSPASAGATDVVGMAPTTAPLSYPFLVSPASLGNPLAGRIAPEGPTAATSLAWRLG